MRRLIEFAFLESDYGFKMVVRERDAPSPWIGWSNGKRKIRVYFDGMDEDHDGRQVEINIFDANLFGLYKEPVDRYRSEFEVPSGSPKEKIHNAAVWLKKAIEEKTVRIE